MCYNTLTQIYFATTHVLSVWSIAGGAGGARQDARADEARSVSTDDVIPSTPSSPPLTLHTPPLHLPPARRSAHVQPTRTRHLLKLAAIYC